MERRSGFVFVARERACPEHLADDGRVLEHETLLVGARPSRRAAMIPWSVSGSGARPSRPSLDVELGELLRVQRVAAARSSSACWVRRRARACRGRFRGAVRSAPRRAATSARVVAFSLPPPQPGRRSSSSGRAVATTRSGTSVTQSTSSSTKSSRLSSAQCRSSKTRTSGRCSASPSRKRRQAEKASLRRSPPSSVSAAEPGECEQVRLDPGASSAGSASPAARAASR